ncbi:hypothetical protein R3I93_009368 [Phoxinus phoxinus]|uniref:Uncharacterized protein n=1 Tax=Phoxinus phoxinus TaxID=58324 RepID=A0AAN9D7C4_9TELE
MARRDDVTSFLQQPASLFDQRVVVSKFMMIWPKVLGVLEISIGIGMIVLTIWTGFLYLLGSCPILVGSVTVSAACKRNAYWVKISQSLNCFNAITSVMSVPFHCFVYSDGATLVPLVVCDVLVFIISAIVTSSSCDCCRMKSRCVAVNYINRDVPYMIDNNIVLRGQQDPFAPPANYSPSPSAPPANYSPSPSEPPPNYDTVPSEPPPNYDTVPSEPPPSYNQVLLHPQ